MDRIDWGSELTRAALPHAVVALLSHGANHGYAMVERLRSSGFPKIQGGTLYPLLKRLEDQGLVDHVWHHEGSGPGRKLFSLTALGGDELQHAARAWQHMTEALAAIRTPPEETE